MLSRMPAAEIEREQARQLTVLMEHARRHSRFYAERLAEFRGSGAPDPRELLSTIPVMRRQDLQSRRADIDCSWFPPEHGKTSLAQSTGSTGEPVRILCSELNGLIWMAMTLREHLWQRRDFSRLMAVIRAQYATEDTARRGLRAADSGPPVNHLFASGPAYGMNLQTDVARQADWLRQIMPGYLLTDPNNLSALLDLAEADGPCDCGRGLPSIPRICGRDRNLMHLPDRRRFWPLFGAFDYRDIAPVRQYQIVQHNLDRVTPRLAVERPLTAVEEKALAEKLVGFLGYRFDVYFDYYTPVIPRGPGGKFEDFICEIPSDR